MKLYEVKKILNADVCTTLPCDDIEVLSACGADLMSDVLAYVKDQGLLLTGLNNVQVVRTAEMMDICCIVFVRGKIPEPEIVALADEKNIAVLKTTYSCYKSCGLLYKAGLESGA